MENEVSKTRAIIAACVLGVILAGCSGPVVATPTIAPTTSATGTLSTPDTVAALRSISEGLPDCAKGTSISKPFSQEPVTDPGALADSESDYGSCDVNVNFSVGDGSWDAAAFVDLYEFVDSNGHPASYYRDLVMNRPQKTDKNGTHNTLIPIKDRFILVTIFDERVPALKDVVSQNGWN